VVLKVGRFRRLEDLQVYERKKKVYERKKKRKN